MNIIEYRNKFNNKAKVMYPKCVACECRLSDDILCPLPAFLSEYEINDTSHVCMIPFEEMNKREKAVADTEHATARKIAKK